MYKVDRQHDEKDFIEAVELVKKGFEIDTERLLREKRRLGYFIFNTLAPEYLEGDYKRMLQRQKPRYDECVSLVENDERFKNRPQETKLKHTLSLYSLKTFNVFMDVVVNDKNFKNQTLKTIKEKHG
jgi:hypothetical protein